MIVAASTIRLRLRGLVSFASVRASSSSPSSLLPLTTGQILPPVSSTRIEHVKVQCGSSGPVTLNLHRPLRSTHHAPVIIFFPRGPIVTGDIPDDQILSVLSESLPDSTIVRLNYRYDDQHRFPIAVHDTAVAYEWVTKNLIDVSSSAKTDEPSLTTPTHMPSIGLCGELIGGGLATMLALTECQVRKPCVTAAAVNSPILDWTFGLDQPTSPLSSSSDGGAVAEHGELESPTSPQPKRRSSKNRGHQSSWTRFSLHPKLSAKHLSKAREMFFRKPESYFDPFASPLLFFRTAGVELPPEEDPSMLGRLDEIVQSTPTPTVKPQRRTTTHRRYPPSGIGLRLPRMRISVGTENILHDQGTELASLMKRSILISESKAGEKFADEEENIADSKLSDDGGLYDVGREKIQLVHRDGMALWCCPEDGDRSSSSSSDVMEAGRWLKDALKCG